MSGWPAARSTPRSTGGCARCSAAASAAARPEPGAAPGAGDDRRERAMTAAPAGQMAAECGPPPRPAERLRPVRGYASGKEDYLRRLRKIEGQVRSLQKM